MPVKKFVAVVMVALGASLDIYYSYARYKQDGLPIYVSIGIGIAVTFSLMYFAMANKKGWVALFILYQIITTSPGQTFLFKSINANVGLKETTDVIKDQNDSIRNEINNINQDIKEKRETLANIGKDLDTQAKYRTTIKNINESIIALEDKKLEKQKLIVDKTETIINKKRAALSATNIYEFYASIGNWQLSEWIMFILHTFLSFLITIMAPIGASYIVKKDTFKQDIKTIVKKELPLEKWVNLMWTGERREPKIMKAVTAESLEKWCEKNGYDYQSVEHEKKMRKCRELGLISDLGELKTSEKESIKLLKQTNISNI